LSLYFRTTNAEWALGAIIQILVKGLDCTEGTGLNRTNAFAEEFTACLHPQQISA